MLSPNIDVLKAMDTFTSNYTWDWPTTKHIAGQIFTFKGEPTPEFKEACQELSEKFYKLKREMDYIYDTIEDLKEKVQ